MVEITKTDVLSNGLERFPTYHLSSMAWRCLFSAYRSPVDYFRLPYLMKKLSFEPQAVTDRFRWNQIL